MENTQKRVRATGGWSILIGSEFEFVDNGDSVQAVLGDRVVYVSSLRVGTTVPAAKLRAVTAARLRSSQRFEHVGQSVQGDAEIRPDGDAWHLHGTMCADGTVATCVVDFRDPDDQLWAISVWKSLLCDGAAA